MTIEEILAGLFPIPPIPTVQQAVFIGVALFTCVAALITVLAPNLFHNALGLVATFFGVTGVYVLLEAEFLGFKTRTTYQP